MSFYDDRVAESKRRVAEQKAVVRRHQASRDEDRAEEARRYLLHLQATLKQDQAALRRYKAMMNASSLTHWEEQQRGRRR